MAIIDLTDDMIRKGSENYWLETNTMGSGGGLNGREQFVYNENRRWVGQLDLIPFKQDAWMKSRVIGDQLKGRYNKLRVHICNYGTPRFLGDEEAYYESLGLQLNEFGQLTYSDGSLFSDEEPFALPDTDNPTLADDASEGDTIVNLSGYIGTVLVPGAFFSINDFLYRVETNSFGEVKFNPPLRRDASSGALVRVNNPRVQVRLAGDDDWQVFVKYGKIGQPQTIEIVEAFDR